MRKDLISLEQYCIITFHSTSHALKAEKVMKQKQREMLLMPTLREISSSCGLSLKFKPELLETIYHELLDQQVAMDEIYAVEVKDKKNLIRKIEPAEL